MSFDEKQLDQIELFLQQEAELSGFLETSIEYSIYDMSSGVTSAGGATPNQLEEVKRQLDPGLYVIATGGQKQKILIRD